MILEATGGTGALHRLPAAAKLLALFGLSGLLFALTSPLALLSSAGLVLAVCLIFCRAALLRWLTSWVLLVTIAAVGAWTAYAEGAEAALIVLTRLGTLTLFATLVTTTTSIGAFIAVITALARPLEKIGIANARDIGLAIGLTIRFVPDVQARYQAIADAHRARGLRLRPGTLIVPLVIGTLQNAEEIASAIDARGIRAPEPR
jgi:biotin transport system permease protein